MPEENVEEPEINPEILQALLQMGIPEVQAKHAIYNTGNSNADSATMWFFENIENPSIQVPLKIKKQAQQ